MGCVMLFRTFLNKVLYIINFKQAISELTAAAISGRADAMGNPNQERDYHGRFTHGLVDSLEQQLVKKGAPNAHALAIEILAAQGSVDPNSMGVVFQVGCERIKTP